MKKDLSPVGVILKKFRDKDGIGLRKQAEMLEISPSYLCDIQFGRRNLTIEVLVKISNKYKYACTREDFISLGYEVFSEDVVTRYRTRSQNKDAFFAIKDLVYIKTGITF